MKVKFPAMQATLGKRQYYCTTMALSEISHFFKFNDWEQADPSLRAQRVLNVSRVPEITKYILDNEDGYIFSSITASYNCTTLPFIPSNLDESVGTIEMDLEDMEFIINDLQQMFSDLNRFVHKTSKSLDILYDHRDNLSALTMEVAELVSVFQGLIDKEKMSIPIRSPKLLTLSALYDANSELLGPEIGKPSSKDYKEKITKATEYWIEIAKVIPDWQKVKDDELRAPALRQEKINTHGVVLRALGGVGSALLTNYPDEWRERLQRLREIDWRKSVGGRVNPLWDNVCIVAGSVVSNRQARVATLAVLKKHLDLPLSNQERVVLNNLKDFERNSSPLYTQRSTEQMASSVVQGSVDGSNARSVTNNGLPQSF